MLIMFLTLSMFSRPPVTRGAEIVESGSEDVQTDDTDVPGGPSDVK